MDFTFVTNRVATGGGIFTTADVDQLVMAGINVVVDCRAEFDDSVLLGQNPNITYLWNGVVDDGKPKPVSWFAKTLDAVMPLLGQRGRKVLCHCAAGFNRGPSMAMAVLMAQGIKPVEAEAMIRWNRPLVGLAYKKDAIAAVSSLGWV